MKYRNLAAIFIVLHHGASTFFNNQALIVAFSNIGHLIVGLFFLWSGWGLGLKTESDGFNEYKRHFFRNSIIPLFLYTFIFNILKVGVFTGGKIILQKESYSSDTILKQIFFIDLPDATEWYFVVLLLIYLFYWIIENVFDNRNVKTAIYAIAVSSYIICSWQLGIDGHWFISIITWLIGYLLAVYQNIWKHWLDTLWIIKGNIFFIIWFTTWAFVIINGRGSLDISHLWAMLLTNVSVISFGIFITYLDSYFELGMFWTHRGDFSLGMYALHPIFLVGSSFLAMHGVPKVICLVITFIVLIPLSYLASAMYKTIKTKFEFKVIRRKII